MLGLHIDCVYVEFIKQLVNCFNILNICHTNYQFM